jgi:hypothetical protein
VHYARTHTTHPLGQSNIGGQTTLGAGNEVTVDALVMDDNAAELGSVRVGVLEDETGWVGRARGLGADVEGFAVRHKRELVPRTRRALIFSVSL